jgi:hypothetical protein
MAETKRNEENVVNNPLVIAWETFQKALETADRATINAFREEISFDIYASAYPKPLFVLSFKWTEQRKLVDGLEAVVVLHTKKASKPYRRENIERIANTIVSVAKTTKITSPKRFAAVVHIALARNANRQKRVGKIIEAVREHATSGHIEWNTDDGAPVVCKDDYGDWKEEKPSQPERRSWFLADIRNLVSGNRSPIEDPVSGDLPVCGLGASPGEWIRFVEAPKPGFAKIVPETEWGAAFLRSSPWKDITRLARPNVAVNAKQSVYVLVLKDETAPSEWIWQMYVGKADDGVKRRWFSTGADSHISRIADILARRDYMAIKETGFLLVDVALAYIWARQKTWKDRAWLFVVACGVAEGAGVLEKQYIKDCKTTDPCFGLNFKEC